MRWYREAVMNSVQWTSLSMCECEHWIKVENWWRTKQTKQNEHTRKNKQKEFVRQNEFGNAIFSLSHSHLLICLVFTPKQSFCFLCLPLMNLISLMRCSRNCGTKRLELTNRLTIGQYFKRMNEFQVRLTSKMPPWNWGIDPVAHWLTYLLVAHFCFHSPLCL